MKQSDIIKGRVSILVPCYNGEKYIKRCLKSILRQTWKDIELIIVNDGSVDSTDEIIKSKYAELENILSRVMYVKQNNLGVGAAMNTALKYFTGEFLAPFDCDDYMMPNSIEVRATWLINHPETAVVQNNGYYVTEDNFNDSRNKFSDINVIKEDISLFDLLIDGKSYNWPGSYMIRSSIWLERCPDREIYPSRSGQNMQLLLPATYRNKCDYIPDCLMKYGLHVGSLSNTVNKTEKQQIDDVLGYEDIYKTVLKSFLSEDEYKIVENRIEIPFIKRIMDIKLSHNNKQGAKEYFNRLRKSGSCCVDDKIRYYKEINVILYYYFRLYRKIKNIYKGFIK